VSDNDTSHFTGSTKKVEKETVEKVDLQTTVENSQGRYRRDVQWRGRSFQTRAAATGKARSATVDNRVRQTISDDDDAERRRPQASRSKDQRNSSVRYGGAVPCKHVNVTDSEFILDLSANAVGEEAKRLGHTLMTTTPAYQ